MIETKFWLSFFALIGLFSTTQTAQAQTYTPSNRNPVADGTLNTQVSGAGNFDITGGLQKGQTLFHSFTDFSVPTSGQANFLNPVGNRDIITRVTGGLFSDINGLVNTNGANFFLINPSGIVFGPNATLNVGKAFVGSTANSLDLVGGGQTITFGTNPNGDALLSVAPNVLFDVSRLNLGGGTGAISNFGTLQTPNLNQYIGLIGGNVNMNGGQVNASGGRVDLGGLSAFGTVSLGTDVSNLRAQFPRNVARGDVSLINGARVDVVGAGGGNATITARNVEILGGSVVIGGILSGLGTPVTVAGDIKISATDNVSVDGVGSQVNNLVERNGSGRGGNVEINARNLFVTNAAQLSASTFGLGDAGSIKIIATDNVSLNGGDAFSTVERAAVGKGGGVEISARNLSVTDGAQLQAITRGRGDAGTVKITATEDVLFDGKKDGSNSLAGSTVEEGGVGNGGSVEIMARNFSVTNGARLESSTLGRGDAGTVKITATGDVLFDGVKDGSSSGALSRVAQGAVGNGGRINITARNLSVTNGAGLEASTLGRGDAGTVKITATGDVLFDGVKDGFSSVVLSRVSQGAEGKGGGVEITARNVSVTNGAQLQAGTRGQGDAGNIKITATGDVLFDGTKDGFRSGALSSVAQGAVGNGGEVEIKARNLAVTNGAGLVATALGQGDAGNIKITAAGDVLFDGTKDGFSSAAFSGGLVGKGGGIEITTKNLSVTNGAQLNTSAAGEGNAGNIFLNANKIVLNNGGIGLVSLSSTGGDLIITTTDYLLLRNNSGILTNSASTGASGNGGNITINSPLIIAPPGDNDITANAVQGNGGKVKINSQGLFGIQFRPKGQDSLTTNDITASSTLGRDGTVNIDTPGTDPGKDSTELPNVTTDASNQISQVCSASNRQNKLTVTGRGGLPPNANDPLTSDVVWQDARAASPQPVANNVKTNPVKLAAPAVGWVFDGKGKVTLVAAGTQGQPTGTSAVCPQNK